MMFRFVQKKNLNRNEGSGMVMVHAWSADGQRNILTPVPFPHLSFLDLWSPVSVFFVSPFFAIASTPPKNDHTCKGLLPRLKTKIKKKLCKDDPAVAFASPCLKKKKIGSMLSLEHIRFHYRNKRETQAPLPRGSSVNILFK